MRVEFCNSSIRECAPREEIEKFLEQVEMKVFYFSDRMNFTMNEEGQKPVYQGGGQIYQNGFLEDTAYSSVIEVLPNIIEAHDNKFEKIITTYSGKFYSIGSMVSESRKRIGSNHNTVYSLHLSFGMTLKEYKREMYGLISLIVDIAGVSELFFTIVVFFYGPL